MTTYNGLTDLVLLNLGGFSLDQDQITTLANDIGTSDLVLQVEDASDVSRGMIEIDDELLWVKSVDRNANAVAIGANGRGWTGTTPTAHSTGAIVKNNPKWPRFAIKRAINDIIGSVFPDLFQVKEYTFTYQAAKFNYDLPADATDVLDVTWDLIGPTKRWPRVGRWRFVPNANTSTGEHATGKTLELLDYIVPGRTIQVTYAAQPTKLVNGSDDFSLTGLAPSAEDVILYGACHRLSGYLDIPRLQVQNIEGNIRSQLVPAGAASNAAKYFYALYQERLNREREILLAQWPRITHLTRI